MTINRMFTAPVRVKVKITDKPKYEKGSDYKAEPKYWIRGYSIQYIPRKIILREADENSVDPYNEYLILYLDDGDEATFRNSFCDMFMIG